MTRHNHIQANLEYHVDKMYQFGVLLPQHVMLLVKILQGVALSFHLLWITTNAALILMVIVLHK